MCAVLVPVWRHSGIVRVEDKTPLHIQLAAPRGNNFLTLQFLRYPSMPATDKVSLPGRPVLRERRKQVSYAESDAESDSSGSANVSGSDDSDQYEYDEDSKSDNANSHEPENPLALLAKLKARRRKRTLQLAAPSSKKQKIKRVITPRSIKRQVRVVCFRYTFC